MTKENERDPAPTESRKEEKKDMVPDFSIEAIGW